MWVEWPNKRHSHSLVGLFGRSQQPSKHLPVPHNDQTMDPPEPRGCTSVVLQKLCRGVCKSLGDGMGLCLRDTLG